MQLIKLIQILFVQSSTSKISWLAFSCCVRVTQAAVARTQNSSAARMEEPRRRVRTSPDALATPRSTDVARMGPRKLKERTLRAVCRFRLLLERRAPWRGTEDPAETLPSNGTSTQSTVDARGSGMVAARVTTIDSRPRRSAKKCACSRKAKVITLKIRRETMRLYY